MLARSFTAEFRVISLEGNSSPAVKLKTLPIKVQNLKNNSPHWNVFLIRQLRYLTISTFRDRQSDTLAPNKPNFLSHPQNEVVYDRIVVILSLSLSYWQPPSSLHWINNRLTTKSAWGVNFNKTLFFLSFHPE